jgi:transposase
MTLAHHSLPSNPDELRALTTSLQAEVYHKTLMIEKLRHELAAMRRARFGRSSEKLDQLELMLTELAESAAGNITRVEPNDQLMPSSGDAIKPRSKLNNRKPLPDHLPREVIRHETVCSCPVCGGTKLTQIGEDEREVLEYVPSHFKVQLHVRPKMSCRSCEKITQAPMPSLPIEKGRPGAGLLAHVLVSKYCDHLPLYRQAGIYTRSGVDLDRSTLADWVGKMAFLLKPLSEAIAVHARSGKTVHADDTTVPVLAPGQRKTKIGRVWALVRDERTWGSDAPPAAVYLYSPNRKAEHAHTLLRDCSGYLHADGYAGFNKFYEPDPRSGGPPQFKEVACWAHARRKIYEVHVATGSAAAKDTLDRMAELFAIEGDIRGRSPEHRLAVRQERSIPLLLDLEHQIDKVLTMISAKSSLAKALRYSVSRRKALAQYTTDGRLEMTNNAVERAIRPLALGRRNWTFAGSDAGGQRAAIIYTIIETAKMNKVEPEAYLRDVIERISDHNTKDIKPLLPWNWQS